MFSFLEMSVTKWVRNKETKNLDVEPRYATNKSVFFLQGYRNKRGAKGSFRLPSVGYIHQHWDNLHEQSFIIQCTINSKKSPTKRVSVIKTWSCAPESRQWNLHCFPMWTEEVICWWYLWWWNNYTELLQHWCYMSHACITLPNHLKEIRAGIGLYTEWKKYENPLKIWWPSL